MLLALESIFGVESSQSANRVSKTRHLGAILLALEYLGALLAVNFVTFGVELLALKLGLATTSGNTFGVELLALGYLGLSRGQRLLNI